MPKEVIRNNVPDDEQPFELVVGWQKDMDVQVGIQKVDPKTDSEPQTLIEVLFDNETLAEVGRMLRHDVVSLIELQQEETYVTGEKRPTDGVSRDIEMAHAILQRLDEFLAPYGSSVWWHPTRGGVNNLIRALRKARDAAFGRDE